MKLVCHKLRDELLSALLISVIRQFSDVDDMLSYSWHQFYRAVIEHIYLLYLVSPEVIIHDYLCQDAKVSACEIPANMSRYDNHVGCVLRVWHHSAIVIYVVIIPIVSFDSHHWCALCQGNIDISLVSDVALCRFHKGSMQQQVFYSTRIYVLYLLGERVKRVGFQEMFYLSRLEETVFILILDIYIHLDTHLIGLIGLIP